MKKYILILCAAVAVFSTSCTKKTTGLIGRTYFAEIKLQGDNPYVVQLGENYVEPGFTATLNGEDISGEVTTSSTVDTSSPGIYSVTYTATNQDGFSSSVSRDVYVLNPGGIPNVYISHCSYGTRSYQVPFVVKEVSPGVYEFEDLFGGFYCYGRYPGYEPAYDFHCEAIISVTPDNTLVLEDYDTGWYFGGSWDYDSFEGTYDPTTGIISLSIEGNFIVVLHPFEP